MKIKTIVLTMCLVIMAVYNAHAQTQTGYRVPAGYDCGNGARVTSRMNFQIGTGSTFIMRYGTTTVTGSGTAGYMMGTDSAYPRWVWTPATNRMNFLDITLQQNGVDIAAYGNSAALAAALSDETGTNTVVYSSSPTINNPTFTGQTAGIVFSAITGSATASQLPTSLAGMTFTGNTNFPSGIWNSSGDAGIGTVAPSAKLHVYSPAGGAAPVIRLQANDNHTVDLDLFSNGTTNGMTIRGYDATDGKFKIRTPGGTDRLVIDSLGQVGIGTASPATLLDVNGAATIRSTLTLGNTGLADAILNSDGSLFVNIDANNNETTKVFEIGTNRTGGSGGTSLMIIQEDGNVGIGTTTPNNILTLPIASATDPIADSWTNHCLADYKDIGTETVEMIQSAAKDKIKNTPVSLFTKKAIISDEEAEREPKQKYLSEMNATYKADLKVFGSSTAVAMQDTSYITELFDSMWDTKADRLTIVKANKQKLTAAKKALPKFQRKNYGIVAEDAPPEAQVLREDGSLQGVDTSVLIGILWANAQKQEARILALETKIEQLKAIINP